MRDSVVFYRSFREAIKDLPESERLKAYEVIFDYAYDDKEPGEAGIASAILKLVKPQIDANNKRYENGKKRTNNNQTDSTTEPNMEQPVTKPEANHKQTISKPQPNSEQTTITAEPNVNVNVNVKDNDIKKDTPNGVSKEKTAKRFTPPTEAELLDYCLAKDLTIDVEAFIDFYASKGWKVGNQPMKDWQAAVRNWARRDKETARSGTIKPKNNLGMFGDYKQTSKDDEWDDLTALALREVNYGS